MPVDFPWPENLPDGPTMIQFAPNCWTPRRWTKRDIEHVQENYPEYVAHCNAQADKEAEIGEGLTAEEWESRPEKFREECIKGCYRKTTWIKGHVLEFGVRGIYVCQGCEYAMLVLESE